VEGRFRKASDLRVCAGGGLVDHFKRKVILSPAERREKKKKSVFLEGDGIQSAAAPSPSQRENHKEESCVWYKGEDAATSGL